LFMKKQLLAGIALLGTSQAHAQILTPVHWSYAAAQAAGKPLLIDFTGHACVNCRKMETTVWPDKQVLPLLRDKYVLVQLYVDDKTELPASLPCTGSGFSSAPSPLKPGKPHLVRAGL
jgi:thioredoxin-related protein